MRFPCDAGIAHYRVIELGVEGDCATAGVLDAISVMRLFSPHIIGCTDCETSVRAADGYIGVLWLASPNARHGQLSFGSEGLGVCDSGMRPRLNYDRLGNLVRGEARSMSGSGRIGESLGGAQS